MKYIVPTPTSKKKGNYVSIELVSSRFKNPNTGGTIIQKKGASPKDSFIDESAWFEKSSRLEQSERDSSRENQENLIFSQKQRRASQVSFDDLKEENSLLKRMLKLKQNEIEEIFEKVRNLEKELEIMKNENEGLRKENDSLEKHQIKEIKEFQAKHNDSYFKEKELDGQFTQDNTTSLIYSFESKDLLKNTLNKKELKDDFNHNKETIFCLEKFKFSVWIRKTRNNLGNHGMIAEIDFQILELNELKKCEILIHCPNCDF